MPRALLLWTLAYGLGGFALGFLFGAARELLLTPAFGPATAHVIEFPLVTGAIVAFGLWTGRRASPPALWIGLGGAALLVALESTMALAVIGMPLKAYLASFDITRGALFPFGLALMAIAPWLSQKR